MKSSTNKILMIWAASLALSQTGCAYRWQESEIGLNSDAGAFTWNNKVLTVTGTGLGLDHQGEDRGRFVFVSKEAGDFEIVARIAVFDGEGTAIAGLMARSDTSPSSIMTVASYQVQRPLHQGTGERFEKHIAGWTTRVPGEGPDGSPLLYGSGNFWKARIPGEGPEATPMVKQGGERLAKGLPIFLKLVRVGNNFGAYKSRDGHLWTMFGNVSGGPVGFDGPVQLGFFVSSGSDSISATASFDSIRIGKPELRYRSSWVGNTFGAREEDQHVANGLAAMWVAPDGTVYTSTYWDEGGRAVTSYKDGKLARALDNTPQTYEGGITGDDGYVYYAKVDKVMKYDRQNPDAESKPVELSVSLHDREAKHSVVSGLASSGKKLFVADSRENLIRVVSLEDLPMRWKRMAANPRVQLTPEPVSVGDDPRLAPALVYQSQRAGEGIQYTFPGLKPDQAYTLRLHLAEFEDRSKLAPDHHSRFLGIQEDQVNVAEAAGGLRKAYVHDVERKANAAGELTIYYGSYGPGVCGVEVLDAAGKRLFAVNSGGPPVGDFEGESQELVARAFAFERPGPMIFDRRGDLWIIQRGNDFPIGPLPQAAYPAAIRCFKPDGTFTGREITDVVNPRGLGYDAVNDRLLVAENGPDLNVRFYGDLDGTPALAKTFGVKGGIYAGANPGRVYDPDAGGYARFQGVAGVGMDADGNLYVGGMYSGTDLRMFKPDGSLGWMLNSLVFCNTYDVDPDSDGADIYATYNHLKLDLSKTEPGSEQTFVGYNWDHRNFGLPERVSNSQSIMRRLGPDRKLFMFITGQGQIQDILIFRYEGELAIPCGALRDEGKTLWIDANGNGLAEDDEKTPVGGQLSWISGLDVDTQGDIRVAVGAPHGGCYMGHFTFKGLNEHGVPIYSGTEGDGLEVVRYPEEGGTVSAWHMTARLAFDRERDVMVLVYPAEPIKTLENGNAQLKYFMARYDRWSEGNRTPTWKHRALDPNTHPEYFMWEFQPGPGNLYTGIMGMQIAGDYLFAANLWGEVHVFDLETGKLAEILNPGPEVGGQNAWEDAIMGLRAFQRKNGEYLIFTENSGHGGKNNFWRWTPAKK